jgi:dihydroflavonol-4-reductase
MNMQSKQERVAMQKTVLVTGATGHLGSHLTQALAAAGYRVKAGVRDLARARALGTLTGEPVVMDLLCPDGLAQALEGVDVLYHAAAHFAHWSKAPEQEIERANLQMTEHVLRAAHQAGVKRVVYVSSTGTLARDQSGVAQGAEGWCQDSCGNPYFASKVGAEKLAQRLAGELDLPLISLLPAAMIGSGQFWHTPTLKFLEAIFRGELPLDLDFEINLVDVRRVAQAMVAAAEQGNVGQRYILANPHGISIRDIASIAKQYNHKVHAPIRVGKPVLLLVGLLSEWLARGFGIEPQLLRSQVNFYYQCKENFDVSASVQDLGLEAESSAQCVNRYFSELMEAGSLNHQGVKYA